MKTIQKKSFKKVLRIIIITLTLYILLSFGITKIVYDACFPRYDKEIQSVPLELAGMVKERHPVEFNSGKNVLQGYLYGDGRADGLVVVAPGFNAGADNYLWQIQSFLDYGFDVFAFDSTGSCRSEGDSAVGFPQELIDLDAALSFVEAEYVYPNIYIFGHSRGGYAACCILGSGHRINAVVSVAGINSAMEAVMEPAVQHAGPVAYGNYHFLWLYQCMLFGSDITGICADEQISGSGVPTMIVQGTNDTVVPMESSSIYSHREEITSSAVEYYICDIPGQDGHTDLLFDDDGTANDTLMNSINQFYSKNAGVSN